MQSKISVKELNNEIVFKVDGDFDNLLTIKYKNLITEILARKRCSLVYFDLSNVSFIDSSGIGLLLGRYKQIKEYIYDKLISKVNDSLDVLHKYIKVRNETFPEREIESIFVYEDGTVEMNSSQRYDVGAAGRAMYELLSTSW